MEQHIRHTNDHHVSMHVFLTNLFRRYRIVAMISPRNRISPLLILVGILSRVPAEEIQDVEFQLEDMLFGPNVTSVVVTFPDGVDTLDQQISMVFRPRSDFFLIDKELEYIRSIHSMDKNEFGDYLMNLTEEKLASWRSSGNERDRLFASKCIVFLPRYETTKHLPRLKEFVEDTSFPTLFRERILASYLAISAGSDEFFSMAGSMLDNSFDDAGVSDAVHRTVLKSVRNLISKPGLFSEMATLDRIRVFLKSHLETCSHRSDWEWMDRMLCQVDTAYADSAFRKEQRTRINRVSPPAEYPPQVHEPPPLPQPEPPRYEDSTLRFMDEMEKK